jgi:hypothetical protein
VPDRPLKSAPTRKLGHAPLGRASDRSRAADIRFACVAGGRAPASSPVPEQRARNGLSFLGDVGVPAASLASVGRGRATRTASPSAQSTCRTCRSVPRIGVSIKTGPCRVEARVLRHITEAIRQRPAWSWLRRQVGRLMLAIDPVTERMRRLARTECWLQCHDRSVAADSAGRAQDDRSVSIAIAAASTRRCMRIANWQRRVHRG